MKKAALTISILATFYYLYSNQTIKDMQRYNKLTVVETVYVKTNDGRTRKRFKCICDCGNEAIIDNCKVQSGRIKECPKCALESRKKHGFTSMHGNHPLYTMYVNMMGRCHRESHPEYRLYGARGIKVSADWFENPKAFCEWCLVNGYQKGLHIDRRDNDKGYSADNCRFVTPLVNQRNRGNNHWIEINGEWKVMSEWCQQFGIKRNTACNRIYRNGAKGMDIFRKPGTKSQA